MILANVTVSVAPVGTSTADRGAWTPLSSTGGELHIEPADGIPPLYDDWPKSMTITVPSFVARQVLAPQYQPLQCRNTRHQIERAGRRWRVSRLLGAALAEPIVLPCPRPF